MLSNLHLLLWTQTKDNSHLNFLDSISWLIKNLIHGWFKSTQILAFNSAVRIFTGSSQQLSKICSKYVWILCSLLLRAGRTLRKCFSGIIVWMRTSLSWFSMRVVMVSRYSDYWLICRGWISRWVEYSRTMRRLITRVRSSGRQRNDFQLIY